MDRYVFIALEWAISIYIHHGSPYIIGLKLSSWRATALHSFAPTLIKHSWSS